MNVLYLVGVYGKGHHDFHSPHEVLYARRTAMKHRVTLAALILGLLVPLSLLGRDNDEKSKPAQTDDKIDKKVVEIVKKTGGFYKNAKTLHVEGTFVSKIDNDGGKRDINVSAVYDVERPNRLCLKTRLDGDAQKGPDVVADGKTLTVYRKALKQYLQEESPQDLGEIGLRLLQVGPAMTGMLFGNVLADDPADLLMQGVNSCSYVGMDKVDGTPVHRMKFSQDQFDWEMWVAAEGKPYILRMIRKAEGENGKVTTTETYKNWTVDAVPAKGVFDFSAPKGATKVDDFQEQRDG
jgi:hypothetical protein